MLSDRHTLDRVFVQIIYGENESGKSTLHAFIRAMLFGMERGRGKAATKDDFTAMSHGRTRRNTQGFSGSAAEENGSGWNGISAVI